ncbi:MAG: hypothetical protein OXU75_04680 [Deltaproteobacteria bacterium]|nr:hypothetical protein [Deltaproteobacteria bacterium]
MSVYDADIGGLSGTRTRRESAEWRPIATWRRWTVTRQRHILVIDEGCALSRFEPAVETGRDVCLQIEDNGVEVRAHYQTAGARRFICWLNASEDSPTTNTVLAGAVRSSRRLRGVARPSTIPE